MSNLDKIVQKLGLDTVKEMEAMDQDNLKKVIIDASTSMKQIKDELDANPRYVELKEALKDISGAKRDADSRQKARIALALELLEAKGQ